MKKINKNKIKFKDKYYFPSVFFGFLSAFAIIVAFFIFRAIIKVIPKLPGIYATISSLVIYALLLVSSYYYAEYDKDLRKSLLFFSVILWIAYLIGIILSYLI